MGYQVDLLHSLISESWKERLGHMKGISEVIHGALTIVAKLLDS
jgi:hypothetical protein